MDALVTSGMNLQDVTVVGHSLGAHIAGRAAKQMKSSGRIACIIGLDPASVDFDFFDKDKRLSDTDADYVQIIHTDGDKFGFANPLGHGRFFERRELYQLNFYSFANNSYFNPKIYS